MDLKKVVQKLDKELGVVSTLRSFGRSEQNVLEIQTSDLSRVSQWLRTEDASRFDFLENLSCYESREKLVLSYFLRSQVLGSTLVLRCEVEIEEGEWVEVSSVDTVWPMACPFEDEISPLFGIRFKKTNNNKRGVLGLHFQERKFPLRKSFVWEEEVL